jgi:hypothetical protein
MDIGAKNLQTGAVELKMACNAVADTMQEIRSTTIELHARLKGVEARADKNDQTTIELGEKVSGHIGVHVGLERAGVMAGRKYGIVYGFVGAIVGSFMAVLGAWKIYLGIGT